MTNLELYCKTLGLEKDCVDKVCIPPGVCNVCPVGKQCEKMYPNYEKILNNDTKSDYLDYLTDMECKWWYLDREE